jgi:hypothetical protein
MPCRAQGHRAPPDAYMGGWMLRGLMYRHREGRGRAGRRWAPKRPPGHANTIIFGQTWRTLV